MSFWDSKAEKAAYATASERSTEHVRAFRAAAARFGLRETAGRQLEDVMAEITNAIADRLEAIERRLPPEVD